jgi:hypothetical protein
MRFYKLDEVLIGRDDVVFKESPIFNALIALVAFGIAIAAIGCGIMQWPRNIGHVFPYVFGGFFALFGLIPFANFRASLRPSNWLLRLQLSGFIAKYRGYENWKLPADTLQAVGFEYGEIAWAKLVKETRTTPNTDGKAGFQRSWLTFIALGLANPDTTELEANLRAERGIQPSGRMIVMDYPVQVRPGGVVEINWGSGIRPSATKALAALGQRVKILETEHRITDLTHHAGANPEEEKAKILYLAQSGDHFAAVRLARQVYGYDLTQATQFVNTLTGQTDLSARP